MPLSKDDRIAFSKKIVEAPFQIISINKSKDAVLKEKDKTQKLDTAHKNLVDSKTLLVDAFQAELTKIDGNDRTTLTESDIQNSASFVLGNFLYPNDPNNPAPSLAFGVWTKTKPYARNKGVGKFFNELYGSIDGEVPLISSIQSSVSSIESTYTAIQRVTGQRCINGTCSNPLYTDQTSCTLNGGVWMPGATVFQSYADLQNAVSAVITTVNTLKSVLLAEASIIYINDTNLSRKAEAQANLDDINNNIIPAINAWLGLADYNTAHGQVTCPAFNAYNPVLLGPTKFQATDINALKAALTARSSFIATRQSQLNGYLGTLTQNLSTAEVSGSGLYYERWNFLLLRLSMMGGSLIALKSFDIALQAQDNQIANVNSSIAAYSLVLTCSGFAAPGNGTKYVHVKSSSGFSVGDNVFIMADDQEEIVRSIEAIEGNRIVLGKPVPANYRDSAFARMYKDLT